MDSDVQIPVCPPPWDAPNDVLPMLIVLTIFMLAGGLIRYWRKKRKDKKRIH